MLPPNFVLGLSEDDSLYMEVLRTSRATQRNVGVQQPNYHAQFLLLGVEKQAAGKNKHLSRSICR